METSNEAIHMEKVKVIEVIEEIVEIEIYVKEGRKLPHAKAYIIRVDKLKVTIHKPEVTGREVLQLAQKVPPENYILRQIFAGGRSEIVGLDQVVDLHHHGVEKFKTLPRDQTEG